jgi:hypothetical protein
VAAIVFGAIAFVIGRSFSSAGETAFAFDFEAPAYLPADSTAGRTKGGFTGLDEAEASDGRAVLSGKIVEISEETATVETSWGERARFRLVPPSVFKRVNAAGRDALKDGAQILVRFEPGSQNVKSILIVAP